MAKPRAPAASVPPDTITVHVPIAFCRRGGRKTVTTPGGLRADVVPRARVNNSLVRAIARAFRWRKLIEAGVYANIREIAAAEDVNDSYVGRLLRTTLLAPDIVEAILDGLHAPAVTLDTLTRPLPAVWDSQRDAFGGQANEVPWNKGVLVRQKRLPRYPSTSGRSA